MKTLKVSQALKVNGGCMVKNWAFDFIGEDHNNDLSGYKNSIIERYFDNPSLDKDITKQMAKDYINSLFLDPVQTLEKQIRIEKSIGQLKWVIDELKDTIYQYKLNQYQL